ncbi:MAG: AAA family ATPase [Lacunisphaera sp.]|nr:AAA family ATPase [Lacunisphaera sp.]
MKITRLEIDDFRAFPGPDPYLFDFAGKNVLIYGENGSGKTSVFHAMRELFNLSASPRPFHQFKHRATPQTDGYVAVTFSDGNRHVWSYGAERPTAVDVIAQTARRKGCLDYRGLLQTNFLHGRNRVNVFDLVVGELWRDLSMPYSGGTRTVGELWSMVGRAFPKKVEKRAVDGIIRTRWQPATHRRKRNVAGRLADFNTSLRAQIPVLQAETQRLLDTYFRFDLSVHLEFPGVGPAQNSRAPHSTELWLDAGFRGARLQEFQNELNEARLTALALALYAAGLRLSIPPDPTKPRLLVLDDVLIGLDLSNRMPLLEMLSAEFGDWQVVLLTHDPVWFEMAKEYTENTGEWTHLRLFDVPHPSLGSVPRLESDKLDLERARQHLGTGDLKASATYARSALEKRLRKVCADKAVRVRFRNNPKEVKANELWQGILGRNKAFIAEGKPPFIEANLVNRIEAVRSVVLNELTHSRITTLTTGDLNAAIHAVDEFEKFQFT